LNRYGPLARRRQPALWLKDEGSNGTEVQLQSVQSSPSKDDGIHLPLQKLP